MRLILICLFLGTAMSWDCAFTFTDEDVLTKSYSCMDDGSPSTLDDAYVCPTG